MDRKATKKALKTGDIVEHTIRSYTKIGMPELPLPTAYCNVTLEDGTVDKRPILPENYDDITLFHEENGKPVDFGRRVKMRITDDTHDSYYLAHYYMKDEPEPITPPPNPEPKGIFNFKYVLEGKVQENKMHLELIGSFNGVEKLRIPGPDSSIEHSKLLEKLLDIVYNH